MFKKLIEESTAKSPWLFHINAGSCNGCDIELVSVLTPRYDAERLGFKLSGTPRHADIVVVTGPVTVQSLDRVLLTQSASMLYSRLQGLLQAWARTPEGGGEAVLEGELPPEVAPTSRPVRSDAAPMAPMAAAAPQAKHSCNNSRN